LAVEKQKERQETIVSMEDFNQRIREHEQELDYVLRSGTLNFTSNHTQDFPGTFLSPKSLDEHLFG